MIIENIKVKNFRQINDKEYKFKKGLNIIKGFNEEGKSTLLDAIITSLFEDPRKISKNTLENIKSWDSDRYPSIEYIAIKDGKRFDIVKDFSEKRLLVNNDEKYNYASFIKESLYLDKDIFLRLSTVKQNQISSIQGNMQSFQKSLFEILSTSFKGNVNIMDIITSLKKEINSMKLGMDRKVAGEGILKQLTREISEKEQEFNLLSVEFSKNKDVLKEILSKKEKVSNLDSEINEIKDNIDAIEKAKTLSEELKNLDSSISEVEDKINRVTKSKDALDKIEDKENIRILGNIESNYKELLNIRERINLREKDLDILEKEKEKIDNLKLRPIRKNSPLVIIVSLVLFLLTAISSLFGFYIFIALFIDIIFIGIYLRFVDYHRLNIFKNPTLSHIDSLKKEIDLNKKRMIDILKESNTSSINEFFKIRTKLISSKEEVLKLQSTIDGILSGKSLEDLESEETQLILQKKEIEIDFLKVKDLLNVDPLKVRRDRLTIEDMEFEKFSLEDEIVGMEAKLSNAGVVEEKLDTVNAILQSLKDKQKYYSDKFRVYNIVLENLVKAKDSVFENISNDLNTLGSLWIERITDGKYSKIDISSSDSFSIFDKKLNRFVTTKDNLSTGLLDQIYILARFSILNVILKDRESIIFLDDPFVTFDKKRLSVTKELLKEFAGKHQIFIFTCHDFFDDML